MCCTSAVFTGSIYSIPGRSIVRTKSDQKQTNSSDKDLLYAIKKVLLLVSYPPKDQCVGTPSCCRWNCPLHTFHEKYLKYIVNFMQVYLMLSQYQQSLHQKYLLEYLSMAGIRWISSQFHKSNYYYIYCHIYTYII